MSDLPPINYMSRALKPLATHVCQRCGYSSPEWHGCYQHVIRCKGRQKPLQCKHIPTDAILRFLAKHQGSWSTWGKGGRYMPTVADAMPPGTPEKLQLAKMRQLHKRGLVGGCTCGCRGDWEITDKGLALIGEPRTTPYNGY